MTSAITTASHPVTVPAPPPPRLNAATASSPPPSGAAAAPSQQQQAALTQLVAKYALDISHGAAPSVLSSLRRQILTMEKTLGRNVTLPQAPANSAAPPPAVAPQGAGKVNITA
jgi:hypothetical protein